MVYTNICMYIIYIVVDLHNKAEPSEQWFSSDPSSNYVIPKYGAGCLWLK